ncbi:hypothetical protein GDO81_007147 [Engystomops pustulosus]|uniref:Cytosolic 5'-nucleotidase 1B n=1 Tax=Engystomops pustulosus TaxID=76066 RepID=A0AAV7C596_ENGPU|nr:hypothetical protein GDO81_007147 [Engystomops pustulosus]
MSGASPDTTQASPAAAAEAEGQHDTQAAKAFYDSIAPKKKPKLPKPQNAITIAVSSRVLFNMVSERQMYEDEGVEKYVEYQQKNEEIPLKPGPAFPFVKAVEEVNKQLRILYPDSEELFDIVLMTNNHAQVGVRLINSINHYGLNIERFCMTGGKSPIGYLKAYLTNLYLSSDSEKVQEAIQEGIAAATMFISKRDIVLPEYELRVAFDGDAVLFSDESEQIVKERGLDSFFEHEKQFENKPLAQNFKFTRSSSDTSSEIHDDTQDFFPRMDRLYIEIAEIIKHYTLKRTYTRNVIFSWCQVPIAVLIFTIPLSAF